MKGVKSSPSLCLVNTIEKRQHTAPLLFVFLEIFGRLRESVFLADCFVRLALELAAAASDAASNRACSAQRCSVIVGPRLRLRAASTADPISETAFFFFIFFFLLIAADDDEDHARRAKRRFLWVECRNGQNLFLI